MTRFTAINLSDLAPPPVVEELDFEAILADLKADLVKRFENEGLDYDVAMLESDPAIKVLEVCAYREMLIRARVNRAVKAVLLPTAQGGDLDNLGANYGARRMLVQAADPPTVPENVWESDERFRERIQLIIEAYAAAGPRGAYRYHAMSAHVKVKDVGVYRPRDYTGEVTVAVLSSDGDGSAAASIVEAVRLALSDDYKRPLTDVLTVKPATIIPYTVTVKLSMAVGPDANLLHERAAAAIQKYAADRHRVGRIIYKKALEAAAMVAGVEDVLMTSPVGDIDPGVDGAAWCDAVNITTEVLS